MGIFIKNGFSFLKDSHDKACIVLQDEAQTVLAYLTQLTDTVMDDHIVNKTVFNCFKDCEAINNGVNAEVILHFFGNQNFSLWCRTGVATLCVCHKDRDLVDFLYRDTDACAVTI